MLCIMNSYFLFCNFTQEMSALAFPLDKNIHISDFCFPLFSISCNVVMPEKKPRSFLLRCCRKLRRFNVWRQCDNTDNHGAYGNACWAKVVFFFLVSSALLPLIQQIPLLDFVKLSFAKRWLWPEE